MFDKFYNQYRVTATCDNCNTINELTIPKGMTIKVFLDNHKAICKNCGCTISKIDKTGGRFEIY